MLTDISDNNNVTAITISTAIITDDFGSTTIYGGAIVIPQTVAKGTQFIRVYLNNGTMLSYVTGDKIYPSPVENMP